MCRAESSTLCRALSSAVSTDSRPRSKSSLEYSFDFSKLELSPLRSAASLRNFQALESETRSAYFFAPTRSFSALDSISALAFVKNSLLASFAPRSEISLESFSSSSEEWVGAGVS